MSDGDTGRDSRRERGVPATGQYEERAVGAAAWLSWLVRVSYRSAIVPSCLPAHEPADFGSVEEGQG